MPVPLKAPFTYFGGKSRVAEIVWRALGEPARYIEPFFGSGAVLLARPNYNPLTHSEIVNDLDGFICNVWRSLKYSANETADYCDWPKSHADLMARKKHLIEKEKYLLENLVKDPKWHDPELAGYWIWAAGSSIGGVLASVNGIPSISDGTGVHAYSYRRFSSRKQQTESDAIFHKSHSLYYTFGRLSERLRHVEVVNGSWDRVCGGNWQGRRGTCGVFLDPPYGVQDISHTLYRHDSLGIAQKACAWAKQKGSDPNFRIVIAGYEEHWSLIEAGWTAQRWSANGGYSNQNKSGNPNKHRECLYFSPHCLIHEIPEDLLAKLQKDDENEDEEQTEE